MDRRVYQVAILFLACGGLPSLANAGMVLQSVDLAKGTATAASMDGMSAPWCSIHDDGFPDSPRRGLVEPPSGMAGIPNPTTTSGSVGNAAIVTDALDLVDPTVTPLIGEKALLVPIPPSWTLLRPPRCLVVG